MTAVAQSNRLFVQVDMDGAALLPLAGGHAAIYTTGAPDKDGLNEDAAALLPIDDGRAVLAVADGLGGSPGGATASKIALECLKELIERAALSNGPIRATILDAVEQANERALELGIGAATTFAALEVDDKTLRPYHVGDSAILVVGQRGKIKLQTVSHSPVGYGLEAGLLDEHEAMHHNERHLISNMIGSQDMRIEVGSRLRLAPRDTALLASDGLFDNLKLQEIVDLVRTGPLEQVSKTLAALCRKRMLAPDEGKPSKPDDLTFVLFRCG